MSVFGRNQEDYPDPTAAEAIAKASKKRIYLPLVYICSKYSGDVVTNTEAANDTADLQWSRMPYHSRRIYCFLLYERRVKAENWQCLWI